MRRRRFSSTLPILTLLLLAGCGASTLPQVHSEAERLALARQMIAKRQYTQAVELLKSFVSNNIGSAQVDEAIYLLGDSELKIKDWTAAQLDFERLLRDYPESDSSAAAAFSLGEALYGQARGPDFDQEYTEKALEQWARYHHDYPEHWRQPEAERRIAEARSRLASKWLKNGNLYLKLKLADPARIYFHRVVDDFSDTQQAADATIGLALADALAGDRAGAIERLRRLEQEFAGQPLAARARNERARLEHR